uniref:Protein kinase domain-containing protein n=2 Tax=Moniliophthora roreri TaxID=221103 RepID=A0A0W0GBD5_MONRR
MAAKYSDTPRKKDPISHPRINTVHLQQLRPLIVQTMGESVPEVSVEWFLQHAIPRFSPRVELEDAAAHYAADLDALGKVMLRLRKSVVHGRWKWYQKDPAQMEQEEDKVFSHMKDISDEVITAGKKVMPTLDVTAQLQCQPLRIGKSESDNSNFKGDANQLLVREQSTGVGPKGRNDFYIVDSVVNYEFKKNDDVSEVNKNIEQLLGNATRIMFSDPARRFRWSVSVENTSMRLWFMSRSICFVSKPFNFVTEQKPLVHFLLATSFASKTDLGYDPTVRRKLVGQGKTKSVVYEYMVYDEEKGREVWYRTVDAVLSNYRANRPLGRAIRVWKVRELDDKGEPFGPTYVLKDYWITLDSMTEGQIQSNIFKVAGQVRPNQDFRKYFMTILHDTIVRIDGNEDTTELHLGAMVDLDSPEYSLKQVESKLPPRAHIVSTHSESTGGSGMTDADELFDSLLAQADAKKAAERKRRVYEPRKHARLVFKEVGQSLDQITDQKLLFGCLIDALYGLKVLHDARYVHRDISTGNLLLCFDDDNQPICKISDLEYARPYLQELPPGAPEHAHKTGTPAFMAVEVQAKSHLFQDKYGIEVQFLHNYFHDVEGVWWIGIWHLFYTCPVESKTDLKDLVLQVREAKVIFPDDVGGTMERREFFERPPTRFTQTLEVLLHNKEFVDIMRGALMTLHEYYRKVEQPPDNTFQHDLFTGCHDALIPFFKQARDIGVEVDHYTNIVARLQKEEEAKGTSSAAGGGSATGGSKGRGKRTGTDAELDTDKNLNKPNVIKRKK